MAYSSTSSSVTKKPAGAVVKKPATLKKPFRINPKKGVERLMLKPVSSLAVKKAMKKPAKKTMKKPVRRPYTIRLEPARQKRKLVYWTISLVDLIRATPSTIIGMLKRSGMVQKLQTKCPERGSVQSWDTHGARSLEQCPQLRCSVRNCRARWNLLHDYVLFTTTQNSASLVVQSQVVFNLCAKVSQASTHLQLNISHCLVESIYGRCRYHLAGYVLEKQKHIVLGVPGRQ
eukprot:3547802-Amphidinium_carterae.1